MKILFTICGRAGSKGIKNKNIREFLGKPLPYYTISAIDLFLKETTLDIEADIVANSDSRELLELMKNNPLRIIETIERDESLAGDAIGKIAVINDCLLKMEDRKHKKYFNQVMKTEHGYKKVIASNFTARQQAPEIYDMNASLYAYSPEFLKSGKGVLDGYCECIEMYDTGVLDLDHENDFELMEVIAKYLFSKNVQLGKIYYNI